MLFVHFAVDPDALQEFIPYELDTRNSLAYFSLVAFTQKRLRPASTGRIGEFLSQPVGTHEFLNLRTYVRRRENHGIYFVAEWIPNRLAALLGPRMYGLPYRLGKMRYATTASAFTAQVEARKVGSAERTRPFGPPLNGGSRIARGNLELRAEIYDSVMNNARVGTLEHFLLERYIAYTYRNGIGRRFRVGHDPWMQTRATVELADTSLLDEFPWFAESEFIGAHYSPGVCDVEIGWPEVDATSAPTALLPDRRLRPETERPPVSAEPASLAGHGRSR